MPICPKCKEFPLDPKKCGGFYKTCYECRLIQREKRSGYTPIPKRRSDLDPNLPTCPKCRIYLRAPKKSGGFLKNCYECIERAKDRRNCSHGINRSTCRECGGSSICHHDVIRSNCRECNDPRPILARNMVSNSKRSDIDNHRFDLPNFINKDEVLNLLILNNRCYYCREEMTYLEKCSSFATIERLDNHIGHILGNCVIACWDCNQRHKK